MRLTLLFFLCLATVGVAGRADYFAPGQRVSGIGVDRDNISTDLLDVRTDRMIESQTFAILRDPQAGPGAKRITGSANLQSLFRGPEREAVYRLRSSRQSPTWKAGAIQKPRAQRDR